MSRRQRIFFVSVVLFSVIYALWCRKGDKGKPSRLVEIARPLSATIPISARDNPSIAPVTNQTFARSASSVPIPARTNLPGATNIQEIGPRAWQQMAALEAEKMRRNPAQQKMDSQLVYASRMELGQSIAENLPIQRVELDRDDQGRVLVDIKAGVTDDLLESIRARGGLMVNSFPQYHSIRASLPLSAVEAIAAHAEVGFIAPAARAILNRVDSEGDFAHTASLARSIFGVNGTNISVGVLSDSVDKLTNTQIAGLVTVIPGQSGMPATGEGTAMLEIVNDLAPGTKLFFATVSGGTANFANNIHQLRAAGCNIIVDDTYYQNESPFQDGLVAQAVNSVTADGALYFAAAGNSGCKDLNFAGTWEGDFVGGGAAFGLAGTVHNFGAHLYNTVQSGTGPLRLDFFWADPLGASTNDYDIFVLSSDATTVVASSTNPQNGTQDAYESLGTLVNGELIVILQNPGAAARFMHLETGRGRLATSTSGNTHGHSCATNAFGVGAVAASNAGGGTNAFTGGNVEIFSSDGPRRVFYQADGTPITPGNFSSTGGAVRQKPDLVAADGVTTDVSGFGFSPFYGTSAAAPHAAAIAALLESYNPTLSPAQIRTLLTGNTIDIQAAGVDRDSGYGIVMALPAIQASPPPPFILKGVVTGGNFVLTFPATPNHHYGIEISTSLSANNWTSLSNLTATSALGTAVDTLTNVPRFYRLHDSGN